MPTINVTKPFPFSVDGNNVIQIEIGEQDVSDRLALVAVDHLECATLTGTSAESDPKKMKVPELKDWLTAKGIAFEPTANKETLLALVPKSD